MTTETATRTRADIEAGIKRLRATACRYGLKDERRLAADAECDALVDAWLAAPS